jgi:hypothetical protein
VKGLGFKYLWIEPLCIVQDDDTDWGPSQLSTLQQIYSECLFSISVPPPTNYKKEFLKKRDVAQLDFELRPSGQEGFIRILGENSYTEDEIHSLAWGREHPRKSAGMLSYAKDRTGMVWECASRCIHENGLINGGDPVQKGLYDLPVLPLNDPQVRESVRLLRDVQRKTLYRWYHIIQEYSQRDLTPGLDRLRGLSRLVETLEPNINRRYTHGIWESDIH